MIWNVMRFHIYNLLDDHNPLQRDNSFALFLLQQLYKYHIYKNNFKKDRYYEKKKQLRNPQSFFP